MEYSSDVKSIIPKLETEFTENSVETYSRYTGVNGGSVMTVPDHNSSAWAVVEELKAETRKLSDIQTLLQERRVSENSSETSDYSTECDGSFRGESSKVSRLRREISSLRKQKESLIAQMKHVGYSCGNLTEKNVIKTDLVPCCNSSGEDVSKDIDSQFAVSLHDCTHFCADGEESVSHDGSHYKNDAERSKLQEELTVLRLHFAERISQYEASVQKLTSDLERSTVQVRHLIALNTELQDKHSRLLSKVTEQNNNHADAICSDDVNPDSDESGAKSSGVIVRKSRRESRRRGTTRYCVTDADQASKSEVSVVTAEPTQRVQLPSRRLSFRQSFTRMLRQKKNERRDSGDLGMTNGKCSDNRQSYERKNSVTEKSMDTLNSLEYLESHPVGEWKVQHIRTWLQVVLDMPQYAEVCFMNVKSGKILLAMSENDLTREIGIKNPLHRQKLLLSLSHYKSTSPPLYSKLSACDHTWVSDTFLLDIGLPQYSSFFRENLIDGRVLNWMNRKQLDKLCDIKRRTHQSSILCAVELLRQFKFDLNSLEKRRLQCQNKDEDLLVWTHGKLLDWLQSIDLGEYIPKLEGSGVHGALLVLDSKFGLDIFANLLGISSKSFVKKHLYDEINGILTTAKRDLEVRKLEVTFKGSVKPRSSSTSRISFKVAAKSNIVTSFFNEPYCFVDQSSIWHPSQDVEECKININTSQKGNEPHRSAIYADLTSCV